MWRPKNWAKDKPKSNQRRTGISVVVEWGCDDISKAYSEGYNYGVDAGADAMARKMLEWLDEPCDNTKHMYFEQKRCFCSECMQQIRKGVGLED